MPIWAYSIVIFVNLFASASSMFKGKVSEANSFTAVALLFCVLSKLDAAQ